MTTATFPIPVEANSASRSLLKIGAVSGVAAAAAAELFTLAARGAGVPLRAADPGAAAAKAIPVGGVAMAVLAHAAVGLLVAAVLARRAKSPATTFAVVSLTYAALSLLGPAFAPHTHLATKLVLTLDHVVAAVVIIPPVTGALRFGRR